MSTKKMIYLDNAATTKVLPEVFETMTPFLTEVYGNPSSVYSFGKDSKRHMEDARRKMAELLGVDDQELYFTSGATEANNWAIFCAVRGNKGKGNHIITSTIEHHAVLHVFEELEKEGFDVTYVPVKENGILDMDAYKDALRDDTIFVSIMYANNEIGTIQPVAEACRLAKEKGALFHTDAVQVVGKMPLNIKELGVDFLSLSGHKFHSPKGIGALYIRKGLRIPNLLYGGGQERKRRPGTEGIANIVGMSKALEVSLENVSEKSEQILRLREKLIDKVLETIPYTRLNGDRNQRIAGNVNFSFRFIEGEGMLLALDMYGICASSGSACTSGSLDPSHVLLGIGLPHEIAHGSLRISLSELTTEEEVDFLIHVLPGIIERLRSMSPLYEDFLKGEKGNE